MAGSVNKVILIGNLGRDPEIRSMPNGDRIANLSIATSEQWRDKSSGERKEKTEWHRVAVYNQNLVTIAEKYLTKGSKVYIEGKLETREYEKDGQKRYSTEITIRQFGGELTLLDGRSGATGEAPRMDDDAPAASSRPALSGSKNPLDDEIPF